MRHSAALDNTRAVQDSMGLQLSSYMSAGLAQTGSVALSLFWAKKDTSYGIRQTCTDRQYSRCGGDSGAGHPSGHQNQPEEHAALCRSPRQISETITSMLLPSWLSWSCRSGQTTTWEKAGRDTPKTGDETSVCSDGDF